MRRCLVCVKCYKDIIPTDKKVVKCSECNTRQPTASWDKKVIVSALFAIDDRRKSILLTTDALKQLVNCSSHAGKDPYDKEEDDICEILLSLQGRMSVKFQAQIGHSLAKAGKKRQPKR